jgi:hypothetical protein
MGIAAYNRGTKCIAQQITNEQPCHNDLVIKELNRTPKNPKARRMFQPTVVRLTNNAIGNWWLMNKQEDGWSSYGWPYKNLRECLADVSGFITGYGRDQHSFFYRLSPGVPCS